jgi:hypothetical protein
MCRIVLYLLVMLAATTQASGSPEPAPPHVVAAERWFRALYTCHMEVVHELASPEVVLSYPIFEKLFGRTRFDGVDQVVGFAEGFCRRWAEPEVVVHETFSGPNAAVLVWSFSARSTAEDAEGSRSSWGGITLVRFDDGGRILAEVGEESDPGPVARLRDHAIEHDRVGRSRGSGASLSPTAQPALHPRAPFGDRAEDRPRPTAPRDRGSSPR